MAHFFINQAYKRHLPHTPTNQHPQWLVGCVGVGGFSVYEGAIYVSVSSRYMVSQGQIG
ncbi:hypothetical protein [Anabaena sp. CCY 9402-a]|uniref:hypothetical protein n=1 Tax=Anabaena sp. CCY 9402-a TaxID=3103867 RepID=UPI0039C5DA52